MPKVLSPTPPPPRPRGRAPRRALVAVLVTRGRDIITERLAPALEVVREPGKPPRVVPVVAAPPAPAAA